MRGPMSYNSLKFTIYSIFFCVFFVILLACPGPFIYDFSNNEYLNVVCTNLRTNLPRTQKACVNLLSKIALRYVDDLLLLKAANDPPNDPDDWELLFYNVSLKYKHVEPLLNHTHLMKIPTGAIEWIVLTKALEISINNCFDWKIKKTAEFILECKKNSRCEYKKAFCDLAKLYPLPSIPKNLDEAIEKCNYLAQECRDLDKKCGDLDEKCRNLDKKCNELMISVVSVSCRRKFHYFLEIFGRGFLPQNEHGETEGASTLYPSVSQAFEKIRAFVKNRFNVIQKNVYQLVSLYYNSDDEYVGVTSGKHEGWSKEIMKVYRNLKEMPIDTSTQPDTTTPDPVLENQKLLTGLILEFTAVKNETEAVGKFLEQCRSCSWSKVNVDTTTLHNLAVQAPEHQKRLFLIHDIMMHFDFDLPSEVDFITDLFITGTYFKHHTYEDFLKWYERCATVLYFCNPYDREEFKQQLAGAYGSNVTFRNMVDKFCFEFVNLYRVISNEDVHSLPKIPDVCKSGSREIHDYIEALGTAKQKNDEYRLIASVIGLI